MRHNPPPMNLDPLSHHACMPPAGHAVSDERLEEFRRTYKEVYGEEITKAEAVEMTHRLLALYKLLLRPLPGEPSAHPPEQPPPARNAAGEF